MTTNSESQWAKASTDAARAMPMCRDKHQWYQFRCVKTNTNELHQSAVVELQQPNQERDGPRPAATWSKIPLFFFLLLKNDKKNKYIAVSQLCPICVYDSATHTCWTGILSFLSFPCFLGCNFTN